MNGIEKGFGTTREAAELKKPAVLYHASSNTEIEEFEPRAESVRDKDEGPMVFASPDRAFATCFLVPTDDSWAKIGRFGEPGKKGPWHVVVSDRDRFEELDHGGAIYTLPSESFSTDPTKGVGTTEWTSPVAVKPIAKEVMQSGLQAMLEAGVQVYFVDRETFERIKQSDDHGKEVIDGLAPFRPEADYVEPTSATLAQACADVLGPEECEELAAMPLDEAMGYVFTLLLEQGVDPDSFLVEKGILEG